ncbi:MAG TPA: hypothetical protein VFY18_04705, partial [Candidatus Limnocylindrales bacterium]|nr:hypothetical protein [Candidatus Limnocylindrales bacterium]
MGPGLLAVVAPASAALRHVDVAIDAAGGGGNRTYSYAVPDGLADLADGEAVLVEFGRRQAVGIVLGPGEPPPGVAAKPIAGRVRADGPLLPPLALRLARWIADHYLAPPSLVLRAMLPPGLLERLELIAERRPGDPPDDLAAVERDLLDQLERGPRPIRDLVMADGRAALVRRLRTLETRGLVTLDWTLQAAGAGPRFARWIRLTVAGRASARAVAAGERPAGRPLGPRQLGALADLLVGPDDGVPGTGLADRHGTGAVAGLARRGLVEVDVRERPRRPLARRPV